MRRLALLVFGVYLAAIVLVTLGAPPRAQAVTKTGTAGDDTLTGTAYSDELSGLAGRDELLGRRRGDRLIGGSGQDHLIGGLGQDVLEGGRGSDTIDAAEGTRDVVKCGPGAYDVASVDRRDEVSSSCELVFHPGDEASSEVVFRDDFDGTALDPAKWLVREGCPAEYGPDNVCFAPGNVSVSGGALHLELSEGTLGRDYDAGGVASFRHGYGWPPKVVLADFAPPFTLEARILFSGVPGTWGAFWTKGTDRIEPTELDVAEVRGALPTTLTCHVHNRANPDPTRRHVNFTRLIPFDFSSGWHTYWMTLSASSSVTFGTYDDAGRRLTCGHLDNVYSVGLMGLILEMKTSTNWGGLGGPPTVPAEMLVDSITVTQPIGGTS